MSPHDAGLNLIEKRGIELPRLVLESTLRKAKAKAGDSNGDEKIKSSGTKAEMVQQLSKCYLMKLVTLEEIEELIQENEENGAQHIFYYKPASKAAAGRLAQGNRIAESIFGEGFTRKKQRFPRLLTVPDGQSEWIDFRVGYIPNKPKDWLAKIYVRATGQEPLSQEEFESVLSTNGMKLADFPKGFVFGGNRQISRGVAVVVRWNDPDLLEFRVSQEWAEDRKDIESRLAIVMQKFEKVIPSKDLIPWNLSRVRPAMASADNKGNEVFRVYRASLRTKMGATTTIIAGSLEEGIENDDDINGSMERQYRGGATSGAFTVRFLANGSQNSLVEDLSVVLGAFQNEPGRKTHEIMIRASATPQAVDYVTEQLRSNDK
jgi:hypothetical protein